MSEIILQIDDWNALKTATKKFDIIALQKSTADTAINKLVGLKFKGGDNPQKLFINFHIVDATGKEALEEFFGEAKKGDLYYKKLRELYAQNGIQVFYY